MSTNNSINNNTNGWEGYGGPIAIQRNLNSNHHVCDPTLDVCCQREQESEDRKADINRTLRQYDVSLIAERRRRTRNLVTTPRFDGCRCCYDPNTDGQEDYPALLRLKQQIIRQEQQQQEQQRKEDEEEENNDETYKNDSYFYNNNDDAKNYDNNKENTKEQHEPDSSSTSSSSTSSASSESTDYDYLLDELEENDNDANDGNNNNSNSMIQEMEERRRYELERIAFQNEVAVQHGYGTHRQIHPSRVLQVAGLSSSSSSSSRYKKKRSASSSTPPPAVVLHLYDPDSIQSAALDLYLDSFTTTAADNDTNDTKNVFKGTIFLRAEGRETLLHNQELVQQVFPPAMLHGGKDIFPALIAIRDGTVIQVCPKLQGLVLDCFDSSSILDYYDNDNDNYYDSGTTKQSVLRNVLCQDAIYNWLDHSGVLIRNSPFDSLFGGSSMNSNDSGGILEKICNLRPEEEALMDYLMAQDNTNPEDVFCCGFPMCQKTFPHEHIGHRSEEQDGLLVPESDIIP